MTTLVELSLYHQVLEVTNDLLGPASQRFIDRQIRNHLQIDPAQLTKHDLTKLSDWLRLSVALLTDDKRTIADFMAQIKHLSQD